MAAHYYNERTDPQTSRELTRNLQEQRTQQPKNNKFKNVKQISAPSTSILYEIACLLGIHRSFGVGATAMGGCHFTGRPD